MPNSSNQPGSGTQQPQFQMTMSDDALVTFGAPVSPTGLSFHDQGFMSVSVLTLGGNPLHLPSGLDGLFIQYKGDGVQSFDASAPSFTRPTAANYTDLSFQIVGYKGTATFGHDASGTPIETGALNQIVLATGSLAAGHLDFSPTGAVTGYVDTTLQVGGRTVGQLDISVQHAASDIGHTATGGLTLDHGNLVASFVPASFA